MTKLYVGGLPFSTTDESLLQLFTEQGYKPVSARIITDRETGRSRGFGFVELGPGQRSASARIPWLWRSFWWRAGILWRAIGPRWT